MEPASVLAFVLLGLKSAKIAHGILTGLKDAPEKVKSAREDVERLLLTLEGLSTCRALEEQGGSALRGSLDACHSDLETFVNKLTSLTQMGAQSSRREKYWKRFLAIWDEKALSSMSAKLVSHTSNLNLHLNILQRYFQVSLPATATTWRAYRQLTGHDLTSNTLADIPHQLKTIHGELAAQQTPRQAQLTAMERQITRIGAIEEGIIRLDGGLVTARQEIQALSLASATHHLEHGAILEQILQQVARLSVGYQASSQVSQAPNDGTSQAEEVQLVKRNPFEELLNIISRLCDQVKGNRLQGRIMSGEAKDVIGDLMLALDLIKSEEFLKAVGTPLLADQDLSPAWDASQTQELQEALATVCAELMLARKVAVNDAGKYPDTWTVHSATSKADRRVDRPRPATRIRGTAAKPMDTFKLPSQHGKLSIHSETPPITERAPSIPVPLWKLAGNGSRRRSDDVSLIGLGPFPGEACDQRHHTPDTHLRRGFFFHPTSFGFQCSSSRFTRFFYCATRPASGI